MERARAIIEEDPHAIQDINEAVKLTILQSMKLFTTVFKKENKHNVGYPTN